MIKQKYTLEFKPGAMEWVEQPGLNGAEAGQRLGIPAGNISRWIREARREQSQMNACGMTVKARPARLRALEKENRRLQMEREVLKKPRPSLPRNRRKSRFYSAVPQRMASYNNV